MPFDNRPTGSELCLLPDLAHKKPGTQIRFLGCVSSYDATTAVLTVEQPSTGTPTRVKALVSLNVVLDRITAEHIATGAWVNVFGRIERPADAVDVQNTHNAEEHVRVQALLIWLTGPLDIQAYEKEVQGLLCERGDPPAEAADQTMADG